MRFLINRWRQIGTRLYLALVFAVILTLLSSAVGIYYFERSGDLSYRIRSESAPAVDAAWAAALSAEKLRSYGREVIAGSGSAAPAPAPAQADVGDILTELDASLSRLVALKDLESLALAVQDSASEMPALVAEFDQSAGISDAWRAATRHRKCQPWWPSSIKVATLLMISSASSWTEPASTPTQTSPQPWAASTRDEYCWQPSA